MKGVSGFIESLPRLCRENDIQDTCKHLLVQFLPSAYDQRTILSGAMENLLLERLL